MVDLAAESTSLVQLTDQLLGCLTVRWILQFVDGALYTFLQLVQLFSLPFIVTLAEFLQLVFEVQELLAQALLVVGAQLQLLLHIELQLIQVVYGVRQHLVVVVEVRLALDLVLVFDEVVQYIAVQFVGKSQLLEHQLQFFVLVLQQVQLVGRPIDTGQNELGVIADRRIGVLIFLEQWTADQNEHQQPDDDDADEYFVYTEEVQVGHHCAGWRVDGGNDSGRSTTI